MSNGGSEPGWKSNPIIGGIAAIVILVALIGLVSRVACRGRTAPVEQDTLTLICPKCNHTFQVSRKDVGVDEQYDTDMFRAKAAAVPCPECGNRSSAVAAMAVLLVGAALAVLRRRPPSHLSQNSPAPDRPRPG